MRKADYSKIASFYDKGRTLSEQNIDLWLELISKYLKAAKGKKLLDLGCGTGRFSIPFAQRLKFDVTGADSSKEMIEKAKGKDVKGLVKWDIQEAQDLKYPDNSFDVVFMSHLLHHVDSPSEIIRECKRVLKSSGVVLIRYGAIEQIRDDVVHRFFPEAVTIDEERTPSVKIVEKWLSDVGFGDIKSEEVVQKTYESPTELLDAMKVKCTSVLTMISKRCFEKGIRRLAEYIEEKLNDPWLLFDRLMLTVGYSG